MAYQGMSNGNHSARHQYVAGPSDGALPLQACGIYAQSTNDHVMLSSPPSNTNSAVIPRQDNVGQQAHSSPHQHQHQHHHQQFHGGHKPSSEDSHWQRQSLDFSNMATPVQQRFYTTAEPSHQQHQRAFVQPPSSPSSHSTSRHQLQQPHPAAIQPAYESPYAPSTGTRERLAMSQSPMSDVLQSVGPAMGRTFNMMAGLETPTRNPPLHRTSAQAYPESQSTAFSVGGLQNTHAAESPLPGHWSSVTISNGQQHAPWPAAESSLAAWNNTNPHPSPVQSRAVPPLHRHPALDR